MSPGANSKGRAPAQCGPDRERHTRAQVDALVGGQGLVYAGGARRRRQDAGEWIVRPLHVVIGRSPRLRAGLVAGHVLALSLLGMTLPGGLHTGALLVAVVVSAGIAVQRVWRRGERAVVALLRTPRMPGR